MTTTDGRVPAFFHPDQLAFRPAVEWEHGAEVLHPESPERVQAIVDALDAAEERFARSIPPNLPPRALEQHAPGLLSLYRAAGRLPKGEQVLPRVFPGPAVPRRSTVAHVGQWAFDTHTPLARETWTSAVASARCAAAAAAALSEHPLAYAASRPPGHHAGPESFGGYCYVNNAALAARALRERGRVTILDIDVHHGNGTQALFYRDPNVQVISIHEDPTTCFPYVTGFPDELGQGHGIGRNVNLPQPAGCDGERYLGAIDGHAVPMIRSFAPDALVLSAGVDTYVDDPLGTFTLTTDDLQAVGVRIGRLGLPTAVIQEGGYCLPQLGANVVALLDGLREGQREAQRAVVAT